MNIRNLRFSLFDAFFFSLMTGVGETYLPAFALKIGMGEALSGLFATVPMLIGAIIQLVTPWGVRKVGSVKRWVVGASVIQALAFLPLIVFAIHGTEHFFILFLVASVYWGAGFAGSPTWNFWMGQLVPKERSHRFFAKRARITQLGILAGIVAGGYALYLNVQIGPLTSVFSLLFAAAFFFRASSCLMLSQKDYDHNWHSNGNAGESDILKAIGKFVSSRSYRKFFGFVFLFYCSIFLSSPFVTPYFLAKLELNYHEYMFALASFLIAKILVLPFAEGLISKLGIKRVFLLAALGVAPLPALWPVSESLYWVCTLQAASGAFWGLFEVGLALIFFGQIKTKDKIPMLTLANLFTSAAIFIGTMLGGQLLSIFQEQLMGYYVIFVLSSACRLGAVVYFYRQMRGQELLSEDALGPARGVHGRFADLIRKRTSF